MIRIILRARTSSAPRFSSWRRCISGCGGQTAAAVGKWQRNGLLFGIPNEDCDQPHRRLLCAAFTRGYKVASVREELRWYRQNHLLQQVRHVKVSGSDLKIGNIIEKKGRVYQVLSAQHTTQGRGGATIQVELRDVKSGLKTGERFRTSESVEKVFVDEKTFSFLYTEDGGDVVLMDPSTFEQVTVPKALFGDNIVYLVDGMPVTLHLFGQDSTPLTASVPPRVTCTVAETEPYYKGQTAAPSYKRVVLENGIELQAPPFVEVGDRIVVNTAENTYVERAK